jgi:hypothetical protein
VLGAVFAGGLATGIYTTNTTEAVLFQLKHRSQSHSSAGPRALSKTIDKNLVAMVLVFLK